MRVEGLLLHYLYGAREHVPLSLYLSLSLSLSLSLFGSFSLCICSFVWLIITIFLTRRLGNGQELVVAARRAEQAVARGSEEEKTDKQAL